MVLRGVLDLIEEGELNPTVPMVVERTGIPERSIFRYFDDIADLTMQAVALALGDLGEVDHLPHPGEGPVRARIDEMVELRLTILSKIHSLGRVARLRAAAVRDIDIGLAVVNGLLRDQISRQFGPEVVEMDDRERETALDVATTLLSFEGYDALLRRSGVEQDRIAHTWTAALGMLFDGRPRVRTTSLDENDASPERAMRPG